MMLSCIESKLINLDKIFILFFFMTSFKSCFRLPHISPKTRLIYALAQNTHSQPKIYQQIVIYIIPPIPGCPDLNH